MTISRKSWHYRYIRWCLGEVQAAWFFPGWYNRLYSLVETRIPTNLCNYFWTLMMALTFLPLFLVVLTVSLWLATGMVLLIVGLYRVLRWPFRVLHRAKGEAQPNLAWEYVKAKKQKVCPMIEFVD